MGQIKANKGVVVGTPSRFSILAEEKDGNEKVEVMDEGINGEADEDTGNKVKISDKEEGGIEAEEHDIMGEKEPSRTSLYRAAKKQWNVDTSSNSKTDMRFKPNIGAGKRRANHKKK